MRASGSALKAMCVSLACALGILAAAQQKPRRPAAKQPSKSTKAPAPKPAPPAMTYTDAIRENNVGMAHMERHEYSDALSNFQRACVMNPESDAGCLNMGIALLNMGRYDDAATVLNKSAERDAQNPRTWFNLGLLQRQLGNPDGARENFEKTAALDPDDADTQYFLGYLAEEARQYDKAIAAFQQAIRLDPAHASAEYGLSQADANSGDAAGAKAHLERFQQLTSSRAAKAIRFVYGEQGKYSFAQEMDAPPQRAGAAIPVHFEDVTSLSGLPRESAVPRSIATGESVKAGVRTSARSIGPRPGPTLAQFLGSGACILDYDGDGYPDIFLVNADGKGKPALFRNTGKGKFADVTAAAKLELSGEGLGCAVGDYDNDGHPDLAVSTDHGIALFHNQGDGTFTDVTDAAGLRTDGLILGLTFFDYDGDGDLDLYATRFNDFPLGHPRQPFFFPEDAQAPGNILWRNQGNGTFVEITEKLGVAGSAPSVGAIGTDINNDRATDLILTGWAKFPTVLVNSRGDVFRPADLWAISMPGPTAGAVALDLNHDGWMDLAFTHWAQPGLSVWRSVLGKSFERVPLVGPGWMRGWGIAALDYDDDGWTDIVAVGETFSSEGRIALLRNEGSAGFRDVTRETGLDKIVLHDPRAVIACDFDGDGATDLLITQNGRPPVLLKNVGGNKNNWLEMGVQGDSDNHMGIEARLQVFAGAQRQTLQVAGASGYLGQGSSQVTIGLGPENMADVVRILWPSGAVQDELQVLGGKHDAVAQGTNP